MLARARPRGVNRNCSFFSDLSGVFRPVHEHDSCQPAAQFFAVSRSPAHVSGIEDKVGAANGQTLDFGGEVSRACSRKRNDAQTGRAGRHCSVQPLLDDKAGPKRGARNRTARCPTTAPPPGLDGVAGLPQ